MLSGRNAALQQCSATMMQRLCISAHVRDVVVHAVRNSSRTVGGRKQKGGNKRVLNDFYFLEAKRLNYLSRAAFKLKQIDEKHSVLHKGGRILDLGCFPGAWLQVACQKLGPRTAGGAVVGIDLKEMQVPNHFCDSRVIVMQGDAREVARSALELHTDGKGFHTVLSDMCHDTMGADVADVGASLDLCECAAKIALGAGFAGPLPDLPDLPEELLQWEQGVLRDKGSLVMKILEGSGTKEFADCLKPSFSKVSFVRPKATRKESREVYIVCTGFKKPRGAG